MANRYQIWDKESQIIVPAGKVFTPEEWIEIHPIAGLPGVDTVINTGVVNGGFLAEYNAFIKSYQDQGCGFEDCVTQDDCLQRIEEFEDEQNSIIPETPISPEERIAAALEAQVMMSLPDEE